VERCIGEGGNKLVFLVHDKTLKIDVAFGLIKGDWLDRTRRQRLQREVEILASLRNEPSIVSVYDAGVIRGRPYIVMEYLAGGDVAKEVDDAADHRLPPERAVALARAICRGLKAAHRNEIVHRDLKPSNVWRTADGGVKLGDFGMALTPERARLTGEGMVGGTADYYYYYYYY
jgi:serine/threonine-protein kinase